MRFILFSGLLSFALAAGAVHKADHRYTIWGTVTYPDGTPAANIPVFLTGGKNALLGESQTNEKGEYRILLHVHNEDLRKVIDMRINNVKRKVRILFRPTDRATERGQLINLEVERYDEAELEKVGKRFR